MDVMAALTHTTTNAGRAAQAAASTRVAAESASRAYRSEAKRSSGDAAEISAHARFSALARLLPEIRAELVEQARAKVARGEYDTPEALDAALDEMLREAEVEIVRGRGK